MPTDRSAARDRSLASVLRPDIECPVSDVDIEKLAARTAAADLQAAFVRLARVYDLCRKIYAETDTKRIFDVILDAVIHTLNAKRAFLAVWNSGRLIPKAQRGIKLAQDVSQWPVSSTMMHRVLHEGISILTTDARHDEHYAEARSVDLHNIRSVICCPIGSPREPIGLVYVDNQAIEAAFSEDDQLFLNVLSNYASLALKNARERSHLTEQKELAEERLVALQEEMRDEHHLVGMSRDMVSLYCRAKKVAAKDVAVLLYGETGVGKEVLARAIHASSPRANGPFIAVNVAALPTALVESELFGHEAGAFTGAQKRRIGRFELADKGTLFLDEVQDIPLGVQPKLLRFLEDRTFERVGDNVQRRPDVRIVCATNKDLAKRVAEGSFREDLFYRLNGITLTIPSLRERREDIRPLVAHFLEKIGSKKQLDEAAMDCMLEYSWPGNVRELKNCIEAIDALVDGVAVRRQDLPERMRKGTGQVRTPETFETLKDLTERIEREHMAKAIELCGGNCERAVRLLGMSRTTFFERKKDYRL